MLNRKIAPGIKDATEFQLLLPPCEKHVLKNGVEVYAINLGTLDTLMVNWIFEAGNGYEEKNLVAAAASALLKNGTSARNAFQINEHFEYYGAHLSRASHHETADITLHCLSKHIGELLPVVAELVTDSIYPQEELGIYKKNGQQRLQVSLKKSEFVAGRLIEAYLYGPGHPYGKYSSLEDYQGLEREELMDFYRRYYQNGTCRIIVAGKLPADIVRQLDDHFGQLPLQAYDRNKQTPSWTISPEKEKKHHIINDPNGVQGSIRIARNFPNRHHPDFQKVQVLNNVFGGFFGSRLMDNIREDKGYTYGIYSYLVNNMQESALMISTEAGKEVCAATIGEVYKEMRLLCEEPIGEEELQMARNYTIGTILGDLDGPFQVASRWKNILLNGLDGNYFYEGIHTVKTIGPGELQELAKKYLDPAAFFELVVI
ncbi:MAG TPA: pitrilysin family protein [Puia sp.]|nr:pitrilysin family protein [Puia sp.]